jgi:NAD(P)-dependent dehydrogenase (short-subunit alcohol dehydrogenase family)
MSETIKTVLITGASRGIGRAIALVLAGPGTHLVLTGRDSSALEQVATEVRAAGAHATPIACDLSAEPHVRHLIEASVEANAAINGVPDGTIDVLINNAGSAAVQPFHELSLETWEHTLRVNLTATFLTCKYAIPQMHGGGPYGGLIINIASIAASQAFPTWSAYSAAKFGVVGFSNAIREELRPRGIRVTVVYPAATDTALWDSIPGEWNRANMLAPADIAGPIAQLVAQPPHVTTEALHIGHVAGAL